MSVGLGLIAQVDMANASLRPGRDSGWLGRLTQRILSNVGASAADITAHSSTWQHDLDQVRRAACPSHAGCKHITPTRQLLLRSAACHRGRDTSSLSPGCCMQGCLSL